MAEVIIRNNLEIKKKNNVEYFIDDESNLNIYDLDNDVNFKIKYDKVCDKSGMSVVKMEDLGDNFYFVNDINMSILMSYYENGQLEKIDEFLKTYIM